MKKIFVVLFAVILIGVSLYTVKSSKLNNVQSNNQVASGNNSNANIAVIKNPLKTKAPDIHLKDLGGKDVSLSDFKGKNVYLNFWATWCGPCRGEMPDIEKLYEETKNSDLVILAVNLGEDSNTVKSFIDSNNYNFKILLDSDKAAASLYNINAIPTSFFIDKNQNIVAQKVGAMSIDEMRAYISSLNKQAQD